MPVAEIHSDLEQQQREEVLRGFASKRIPVLVATDILSRGIDVDSIELVINFDIPSDGEDYVHRIGRTARAETDGTAITLVGEMEQRKFHAIEQLMGIEVPKITVPEQFGPAPAFNPQERRRNHHGGNRNNNRQGNNKQRQFRGAPRGNKNG